MKNRECIYPGSFDPITLGHIDIIKRSLEIFDTVHIAVLKNTRKQYMFSQEKRLEMIKAATKDLGNVKVHCWEGLLVDFAKSINCNTIVRGVRNYVDFDFEHQAATINNMIAEKVDTVFLPARPELSVVSSSNVRELISFGGDIEKFVPSEIINIINRGN